MLAAGADLEGLPFANRRVPEWRDDAVRQRVVYSYRLIFRVRDDRVEILAVIHGARLLTNDVRERD